MRFSGSFFELTGRRMPATAPAGPSASLIISVAKRIVPSSVRRNTVKRIAREAWRASMVAMPDSTPRVPDHDHAVPHPDPRVDLDPSPATGAHRADEPADAGPIMSMLPGRRTRWMLRLTAYPGQVPRGGKGRRGSLPARGRDRTTTGVEVPTSAKKVGFPEIKRLLRVDADALLRQVGRAGRR